MNISSLAGRLAALPRMILASRDYRRALARGLPAGSFSYRFTDWPNPDPPLVELRVRADGRSGVDLDSAERWCRRQTIAELRAVGLDAGGNELWRIEPSGQSSAQTEAAWFAAPGGLPDVPASHLEQCLLVAAAEVVDAVVIREGITPSLGASVQSAGEAAGAALRPWALYRSDVFNWQSDHDTVRVFKPPRLVKLVDSGGAVFDTGDPGHFNRHRRGPYLTGSDPGAVLRVGIRDAARLHRRPTVKHRKSILVLLPFIAHGGIEHVLFETMGALADRYEIAFATLAPHRPELGDRRPAFRDLCPRLYSLGDLVHPDAMYGILSAIMDGLGTDIVFNANGTTIFYEIVERLRTDRPSLRIIDHLYDHRVGYIDRYTPELQRAIDACVAVNHRIVSELTEHRGWKTERVPVIWPCGRSETALPAEHERADLRRRLRRDLGYSDSDVVVLTAARMDAQKRPLDLVALAERVIDLDQVHFLIVGGGALETDVDCSIQNAGNARVRRMAFRNDIPDLIVAADLGCLVSDFEGLPVFFLECLQLGRPFLGTRVGDLGAVLDETGAGVVVESPGDLDALEEAIRSLVDPGLRSKLAARALDAAPRFSVEACADAYARVFEGEA